MTLQNEIGTVIYEYGTGLYANITNRCPCRCEFCIRDMADGLGTANSLWLKREPMADEVKEMIRAWDVDGFEELVFCGYGEPTERLDVLLEIARFVKETTDLKVRINTNGLSDLINGKETVPLMAGVIDKVSVSLNQCTAEKYESLCHPKFGLKSWDAMLKFTGEAKKLLPEVAMSVVGVIPEEDIARCREIAAGFGIVLRVR